MRPTAIGATRGGPHHASCLCPDQCMLCRQVGHRASECPNKRKATVGTYALGCAVFDATCNRTTVEETEQDQDQNDIHDCVTFSSK